MISDLNDRSREIFRRIVDSYLESGDPVGSQSLAQSLGLGLSPATIRNVMADLETAGLIYAPHRSAGRLPTHQGLRLFVDGMMETRSLSTEERQTIEQNVAPGGGTLTEILERAGTMLSGLSSCAGLVVAPKKDKPVRQIQFVNLGPGRVLVVLVSDDGMVENRIMEVPADLPALSLVSASNYLSERAAGKTLAEVRDEILREIHEQRSALDTLSAQLVEQGLALKGGGDNDGYLIVRGQARLLEDVNAIEDLEQMRQLLHLLEERETMARLLDAASGAQGIRIYIGAENTMFRHAGLSMIVSPYRNAESRVVGAIGVIGPTRINYGRIIPIVDYTSQVLGRLMGR